MDGMNCLFKRDPAVCRHRFPSVADCANFVWNQNSGENEKRKLQIKLYGLTQREDGLHGLVIRR